MTILDEIFANKVLEVEASKSLVSELDLKAMAHDAVKPRGFRLALLSDPWPVALIAEVKKASPSEGVIRADFDPVDIAQIYEREGASCLSVLTDERYFQGSQEYFRQVRATVSLPLLRKDFICDSYQLWESKAWGADAILLIVAYWMKEVPGVPLKELYAQAKHLGLDVLVEVHDDAETEVALELGADLIGVNNRDLSTFKTSLATSERLIPRITKHALAVSESALSTREDVERVTVAGARAVLIGTSFCRKPDIAQAMRDIMPRSEMT